MGSVGHRRQNPRVFRPRGCGIAHGQASRRYDVWYHQLSFYRWSRSSWRVFGFSNSRNIPSQGIFGNSTLVPKAVLGVSNNFQVGNGIQISVEYHYSGFGATHPSGIPSLLSNSNFQNRLIRGDTQIIGTQAIGIQGSYVFNPSWSVNLAYLQSLIDSSGVIAPSGTWDFSDSASLLGTVFVGYGAPTLGGVYQSQYGAVAPTVLFQLRIYD